MLRLRPTLNWTGEAVRAGLEPFTRSGVALSSSVRGYNVPSFRGDLLAGLTVAMVMIPQAIAFARIAEVPAIYGVYTGIVATTIAALFTSSSRLTIGPTNTMSLLTAVSVAATVAPFEPIQTAILLAFMAGLMQIIFAVGRMGELVRYVSHSVIVGFSAGAGVLIIIGQLPAFVGLDLSDFHSPLHGVLQKIHQMLMTNSTWHWQPIMVGGVSIAVALVCRRISKLLPGYLLAVVAGALIAYFTGWGNETLRQVGELPHGLPGFAPLQGLSQWEELLPAALAIALLGSIEVCGISRSLAGDKGERIDPNREFLAVGVANVVGSFFRCIPSSGSYSRSALNAVAGARTRFGAMFGGLLTAGIFLLLAPAARYIPMASIAAILFVIGWNLIDFDFFKRLIKSNKADVVVCLGTFISTLVIPFQYAVFVGVFLNLALYLRRAGDLYMTEMVRAPGDAEGFIERPIREDPDGNDVIFLQVEGNLFFATADDLRDRFNNLLGRDIKVVILRLKRTHLVDATIMHVIQVFADQLKERGSQLVLCGLRPRMLDRMQAFGLIDDIGEENVFVSNDTPFSSAKSAVARARELVAVGGVSSLPRSDRDPPPESRPDPSKPPTDATP